MKILWNSRTASEYRMPLLYNCSTSFSSCSFTANSPQRSSVEFSCRRAILYGRQHHRLRRKQGRCYVRSSTENTREKGCDIGYALATGSCEKPIAWRHAPSQPLDAITAFAVPNPNHSSQGSRFFQVWLPSRSPCRADHPVYFGLAKVYFSQPFRPSTRSTLNSWLIVVNAAL